MSELAEKLYDLAADMGAADYAEMKETDISALVSDLEKFPEDSALFCCIEMIANQF